jgi:hypothetical protein
MAALQKWALAYDRTLNQEYPPESGFANPAQEQAFVEEGRRLCTELRAQLGAIYKVIFTPPGE